MDLTIPKSWLDKHLDTKATPQEFAKYMSLCGPSVERIKRSEDNDYVYSIEVTTNRVDTASVAGIAREAATILPTFGIPARLKTVTNNKANYKFAKEADYLNPVINADLCPRFTVALIKDVSVKESPKELQDLLIKVGVRPINNLVDITNYIMHDTGQPAHVFDYDKIVGSKMILREAKKGETVTTLDGKIYKLTGGDIVIEDGSGKLIDLCGIMGGLNSAIDEDTKNVLLFVQTYNQHKIRKTSMLHGIRTEAAVLFEKGLDPELVKPTILTALGVVEKLAGGRAEKEVIDIYPRPYKQKTIITNIPKLNTIIGVEVAKTDIIKYLSSLGFGVKVSGDKLTLQIPSYRSSDIDIPEDIAEEIARIYGYHNLPSRLMTGSIPDPNISDNFELEQKIKNTLASLGGMEVFNLSLVTKEMTEKKALKLKNPLGSDTEYLRTSLRPSLINAIGSNAHIKSSLHLFEVSNIYVPKKSDLPEERLMVAGVTKNNDYRINKGLVESFLKQLNIVYQLEIEDKNPYMANQRLIVISGKHMLGELGNLNNGYFYYEFDFERLVKAEKVDTKYKDVTKYPPQVEDLTLVLPEKTYVGNIVKSIKAGSDLVTKVELKDVYDNSYTFNIEYQDPKTTLTDKEIEIERKMIISKLDKFSVKLK